MLAAAMTTSISGQLLKSTRQPNEQIGVTTVEWRNEFTIVKGLVEDRALNLRDQLRGPYILPDEKQRQSEREREGGGLINQPDTLSNNPLLHTNIPSPRKSGQRASFMLLIGLLRLERPARVINATTPQGPCSLVLLHAASSYRI